MAEPQPDKNVTVLFSTLHERAKELSCLYRIDEILRGFDLPLEDVFRRVAEAIPSGWQFPECCQARIAYGSDVFETPEYEETPHLQSVEIRVQDSSVGRLSVSYREATPEGDCGPFLSGEVKLINLIAEHLGQFILHQRLRQMFEVRRDPSDERAGWRIALDILRTTDQNLFIRVSRKMMNYLGWRGVAEARSLLQRYAEDRVPAAGAADSNAPQQRASLDRFFKLSEETFEVASANLTDEDILGRIQKWTGEERSSAAVKALEDVYAPLNDVFDAMRRCQRLMPEGIRLPQATANSVRVALIRRFFTEQLEFINVAKKYVELEDFFGLMERIVFPPNSRGKLGGKSAGLFLARRILRQAVRRVKAIGKVRTPKTWYVTSDAIMAFLQVNNLEDIIEQKYKDIDEVRQEYPHLIQVFKNCTFPPEIVNGLSLALDDFGDVPLIVRSSSLLEDRLGTAFAGKYKSLFLANRGDKKKRLDALCDAVAEVYASTFGPDPIQYRAERGLLDFYEEMGIMIQEVVGKRVGRYFLPAFAGVAFGRNEFRWSPRIRREDGLVRLVPGLGTRAVDRVSDDYPVLVAPSRPNLRVNASVDEVIRYSPKKIDVIDLEKESFETLDVHDLLRESGADYPAVAQIVSIYREGILHRPLGLATDFRKEEAVVTFDGLISGTEFVRQLEAILKTLEAALGTPVDIEFASDGTDFFLLQCRSLSMAAAEGGAEIPLSLPEAAVVFSANRYVSNGRVPDITHIVYVDPERYNELAGLPDLVAVGQAVGKLNKALPKRQFILMGPGRWGSRGDIKLGVRVTYADICNAAMLIEVARRKGNYVPDVSFGTHFFQDLVESGIRYLPLYPDDPGQTLNETWLRAAPNILAEILPEHAPLAECLRVVDVPRSAQGRILRVLLNADLERAVAFLAEPGQAARTALEPHFPNCRDTDDFSCWRLRLAEQIAFHCPAGRWGVKAMYLFGSAADGTAGPSSDIDLLVLFQGRAQQRKDLELWLQGWSLSLAEMNYLRTGYHSEGLLDIHIVTPDEMAAGKGLAGMVKGSPGSARELTLGPS